MKRRNVGARRDSARFICITLKTSWHSKRPHYVLCRTYMYMYDYFVGFCLSLICSRDRHFPTTF